MPYALHACRDAGAALARWQQYEHLIANVARMEVRVDEVALTAIVQFARNITGTHDSPAEVCFVHPPPVDTQPYADYFGCPVRFGQPVNRLAIDYLNDPRLTLAEVAWLLGYSEHSALTRAFRRWTGESPQQWRRRQPARAANVARG